MLPKNQICLYLVLAFILFPYKSNAQLDIWPYLKHLDLKFTEETGNFINRADRQKEGADILISQSASAEDRKALEKAFNELFSASDALFEIYDRHCTSVRRELPGRLPAEFDRAVEFEQGAESNMKYAGVLREEALRAKNFDQSLRFYEMAFDLEQIALLSKGRALRMYQDFPVIYEYPWDSDFTDMDNTPIRAIRIVEIDEDEAYSATDLSKKQGISYIIQIAAHTGELTGPELRAIYRGSREINMIYEDGWYKYYIGPWERYEDADAAFKSLNVSSKFIAAYLSGKRIGVAEARRRQARQN